MGMGGDVYKAGKKLQPGGIMYNQYKNKLRSQLDQSGESGIMSIIHDGLVGDTPMIDDPVIKQAYDAYQAGDARLEELRNVVVDNYMNVLVRQSEYGVQVNQRPTSKTDQKWVATQQLVGDAYGYALTNKDLSGFNHSLPTGWSVDWEDEDEGIINIYKGDYSEYTLNLNDPRSFYTFLNINKVPKHLWIDLSKQMGVEQGGDQSQGGGGGSYDDL